MNTLMNKFKWIAGGLALSLCAGAPAVADDTELLLSRPDGVKPKPNVVFIVDSSGSMTTTQNTREVYDAGNPYPLPADNACDPNRLYWTEVDVVPSCDPANTRYIEKTAYLCADSVQQLAGIGRYTGVHGQYRDGASGFFSLFLGLDAQRWQRLAAGNANDKVECGNDFGEHGDGGGERFPQKGGDVALFTSDEDEAVSWGSWPTSQVVTLWDGNYLNYLRDPTFVDESRINIVKDVSEAVLNSIGDVNVAIMRFNGQEGGAVISAMKDLDANRAEILGAIDGIVATSNTPLSETLYEAALYWRGMPAYYGNGLAMTDPDALKATGPDVYQEPSYDSCAKNFNIVLTDGAPVADQETPSLVDGLPNWFGTLGYSGCTGTNMGDCLDDLAAYMKEGDVSLTEPNEQQVITHTIGFAVDLDILEETAERGGGTYFQADNVESLTLTLLDIVSDITEENLSFAAPAVAVNSFNRTQNLNDLYMTTFRASEKTRWPGNLKKYEIKNNIIVDKFGDPAIDDDTGFFRPTADSFWSSVEDGDDPELGGAAENLPDPDVRRLFTDITSGNLTADNNALHPDNVDAFEFGDFGLTGSADEPSIEDLIRWTRGEDILDFDSNPDTKIRPKRMGDSLHAQPAAVVYGGSETNPDVVVFSATNDGKIHAVDAETGQELWAFMPREHLPNLVRLFFNPDSTFKLYGVDGDIVPVVADRDDDGVIEPGQGEFVHIIFGMRRGGTAFYSLDVTNKNSPKINWRVDASSFGQSWSRPTIARIDTDRSNFSTANDEQAVVVIGGGYDTVHDTLAHPTSDDASGAGVYMLDLHTGDVIWRAGPDGAADLTLDPDVRPGLSRSIVSQIRVIDINGDGFADRMYAADLGGQILRFDIFSGKEPDGTGADAFVTGGVIAQLGAEGLVSPSDADTRRFYTSPDVSVFTDNVLNRRFAAISIGSGYRPHPLDNTPEEKFFSVRDADVFSQLTQDEYNGYSIVRPADLVEVSGSVGVAIGNNKRGWMLTLPPNQKVMSTSVTFDNEVFFVGFAPDAPGATICKAGIGNNWLYRVSVVNGDPIINNMDTVTDATADAARVTELRQGGIAPSPRFLFPSPEADCTGDECSVPPIGCIGVECFDPGFENFPVRTLWTQDGIQ